MGYDVAEIRGRYTSITNGWTYLNALEAPQLPERVSAAIARGVREAAIAQHPDTAAVAGSHRRGTISSPTLRGAEFTQTASLAIADLVGVSSDAVILGPSREALLERLQRASGLSQRSFEAPRRGRHSKSNTPDAEYAVVVGRGNAVRTALEEDLAAANQLGIAEPDLGTGEIPDWQFVDLVSAHTRLVVIDAANPYVGAIHDVAAIAAEVRTQGSALILVDATAIAPYRPVRMSELDADVILLDCAFLGGPQVAALAFRDPVIIDNLDTRYFHQDVSLGLLSGVAEAIDLQSRMIPEVRGTRRKRLAAGMPEVARHFLGMSHYLSDSLDSMHAVHVFGVSGELAGMQQERCERLPTATFCIPGVPATTILDRLYSHGLVATRTPADPVLEAMGLDETEGAVTVTLAAFNTTGDVDQLLRALASLA
ncbi:MAG: aminotransferase class V-fold PLP-dependent enzyme [Corynebacterium sp.]|nr:aminotransferase class V-fold PLP-dependent enzyme [Corynebacterium sp.]